MIHLFVGLESYSNLTAFYKTSASSKGGGKEKGGITVFLLNTSLRHPIVYIFWL
jgi:hypothetical protein